MLCAIPSYDFRTYYKSCSLWTNLDGIGRTANATLSSWWISAGPGFTAKLEQDVQTSHRHKAHSTWQWHRPFPKTLEGDRKPHSHSQGPKDLKKLKQKHLMSGRHRPRQTGQGYTVSTRECWTTMSGSNENWIWIEGNAVWLGEKKMESWLRISTWGLSMVWADG